MPASLDRIRKSMKVEPTPQGRGLVLTLRVVARDNGMIEVDGIPINAGPPYDEIDGWLGTADVMTTTLREFRDQVERRRREMA
jgi:hypothetical protein